MASLDSVVSVAVTLLILCVAEYPQAMKYLKTAISYFTAVYWRLAFVSHTILCRFIGRAMILLGQGDDSKTDDDNISSSITSTRACCDYLSVSSTSDCEPPVLYIYVPAKKSETLQWSFGKLTDSSIESRTTSSLTTADDISTTCAVYSNEDLTEERSISQLTIDYDPSLAMYEPTIGGGKRPTKVDASTAKLPTTKVYSATRQRTTATVLKKKPAPSIRRKFKPIARLSSKIEKVKETRKLRALLKQWDFVADTDMVDDCDFLLEDPNESKMSRKSKGSRKRKAPNPC